MPTVQQVKVYENGQWVTKVLYFPPSSHDHPNYLDAIASLDLRISDIEKNGTGGGGGGVSVAKVNEIVESYLYDTNEQATLPSTGQIDNIYFNQYLTKEEVIEILSTLDMITYDENSNYYRAFYGESGNYLDIFYDTNEGIYSIKYANNTIWSQANNNGFTTNSISVNDVSILLDWAPGAGMSVQNVKLTDLISNAPFYKNSVYALATELKALSDRVSGLESNSGGINTEEVNKIIEKHLIAESDIPYKKGAYVGTVYFNTSLSKEEVHNILDKLDWETYGWAYPVFETEQMVGDVWPVIMVCRDFTDDTPYYYIQICSLEHPEWLDIYNESTFGGWNNEFIENNGNSFLMDITQGCWEGDWGYVPGIENELLKDLVYTFGEKYTTKEIVKDISSDVSQEISNNVSEEVVKSYLFTGGVPEPTAVPNTGYIQRIYFNTSLSVEEVQNILNSTRLFEDRFIEIALCSTEDSRKQLFIELTDVGDIVRIYYLYEDYINGTFKETKIYDSEYGGWLEFTNPIYYNGKALSAYDDGYPIGDQNELLKDLISSTPFDKVEKYTTPEKVEEVAEKVSEKVVENYLFEEGNGEPVAIPTKGYVGEVYFNTNLSINETAIKLLSIYKQYGDVSADLVNDGTPAIIIQFYKTYGGTTDDPNMEYRIIARRDLPGLENTTPIASYENFHPDIADKDKYTFIYKFGGVTSSTNGEWNPEITYPIKIQTNVNTTQTPEGLNEMIKDIAYARGKVEKYATSEKVEEVVEKQLVTKSAVPIGVYVDKVYFNTNLTNEQVVDILKSITYIEGSYVAFLDQEQMVIVTKSSVDYGISLLTTEKLETIFQFGGNYTDFTGWNPNITNPIELNSISLTEITGNTENDLLGTRKIGDQNELLKDLVYIQSEKYLTKETGKKVIESYLTTPTAILNKGFVDTVYFDTNLTPTEVDSYLSKLTYVDFNGMAVNVLFTNTTGTNNLIAFQDGVKYEIFHITSVSSFSDYTQIYYTDKGWLLDKFEINDTGVSELIGLPIGAENDIIKDVVYMMSDKYTTKEQVESYLFEESTPTTVPNTGLVENLYINTELTHEEIVKIIKQLYFVPFGSDGFGYCIAATIDGTSILGIMVDNVESPNFLAIGDMGANPVVLYDYEGIYSGGVVNGWNTAIPNPIPVNVNAVSEFDGVPVGQQNDLIKNLVSITQFGKQEKYTTPEKVESYLHKNVSKVVELPAGGYVGTVYFKTSLSNYTVNDYLLNLTYVDFNGLQINVLFANETLTNVIFVVKDGNDYGINHSSNIATMQYTNIYNSNNGWAYDEWEINDTGITESMGISIGAENYLIKDIVNIGSTLIEEEKYVENVVIEKYVLSDTPDKWYMNFTFEDVTQIFNGNNCTLNLKDKKSNSEWFLPLTCKIELDSANKAAMFGFRYFNLNGLLQNVTVIVLCFNGEIASFTSIEDSGGGGLTEEQADAKYATKTYVLQEIKNYMSTNYENGNEGSY